MKKIILFSFICFFALGLSRPATADTSYTLLEPLPCIPGTGQDCENSNGNITSITKVNIDQYVTYVVKLAIALAVFLAVVEIIWGGFEWMLSAVPYVKVEGKQRISNAIFGLLAVLASYLVLRTIDPRLVMVNTQLPVICPKNMQTSGICDMTTLARLEKTYLESLGQAANDQQLKALEYQSQVNDLDKERNDIEAQWLRGEIDEYTYKTRIAEIEMQKNGILSQRNLALGNYEMSENFQRAVQDIRKSNGVAAEKVEAYRKMVDDIYNKYKVSPGLGSDPANQQKLQFLKVFFTKQIDEENLLSTRLFSFVDSADRFRVTNQTSTKFVDEKKVELGTMRVGYEAQLKFLEDPNAIPITTLNVPPTGPTTLEQAQNPTQPNNQPTLQLTSINDAPPIIKNDQALYQMLIRVKSDATLAPVYRNILRARMDEISASLQKVSADDQAKISGTR